MLNIFMYYTPAQFLSYQTGDFLPFSRGQILNQFPIKNSHLFSPIPCLYFPIKKSKFYFLAHLSRRLMGELIVYQSLRHPSVVRPQFQTSSPLKLLGQLNSNFIWRLLRMGERKFVQMVLVTWPKWPPCPYMLKTL